MYKAKKATEENLNKFYNTIDWDFQYDERFIRDENRKKNINYRKRNKTNNVKYLKQNYLDEILYLFKKHLKSGGTEFGFKIYLMDNYYTFECKCCKKEVCINDIDCVFTKKEIFISICNVCLLHKNIKYNKDVSTDEFIEKHKKNIYQKQKRKKEDPLFKLISAIRSNISSSFKRGNNQFSKKAKTEIILGCTIEDFILYIQSKFTEGMTLENYGLWHLDHIKPVSLATTEEEVILLNNYTNFQPLWAEDNLRKGAKF